MSQVRTPLPHRPFLVGCLSYQRLPGGTGDSPRLGCLLSVRPQAAGGWMCRPTRLCGFCPPGLPAQGCVVLLPARLISCTQKPSFSTRRPISLPSLTQGVLVVPAGTPALHTAWFCVSVSGVQHSVSVTRVCTYLFSYLFIIGYCKIQFPVLDRRNLVFICSMYSR